MKILVCGGAGFIGSNFIRHMFSIYINVRIVNYDKLTYAGNLANLKSFEDRANYEFIEGDICDFEFLNKVVKERKIDYIVNFAAETHVDRSIYGDCINFVNTNVGGVLSILNVCKENKMIKRFINVSTDEVYGSLHYNEKRKFREDTPIKPNMPYAAAKAGGDLMCASYFKTHNVPVIVTHCSNNYGPYQYPEKLIPMTIFRANRNELIPIYGTGRNVRDWIYVEDHCRALSFLLKEGVNGRVYNIGADNERSNLDIVRSILTIMNKPHSLIEFVKDRPGHDKRYAIDARRIMGLGWEPVFKKKNFIKGLQMTVRWYLSNKKWVEDLEEKNKEAYKINNNL